MMILLLDWYHFIFYLFQILVPVPQYPLYSATISLLGGSLVPYYLEETANWGLDINNLRDAVRQATFKGITVRMHSCASCSLYGNWENFSETEENNKRNYVGCSSHYSKFCHFLAFRSERTMEPKPWR